MSDLWQQLLQKVEEQTEQSPVPKVPEIVINDNEDDEYEEEDDFEEGVDIKVDNTFNIAGLELPTQPAPQINLLNETLITPTPKQTNKNAVDDIFSLAGITSSVEVTPKRGPGRPKKTAQQVINSLPENISSPMEQEKSITNSPQRAAVSQQERKDIAMAIPKATLLEIGESLQRIGAAFIQIART